MKTLTLDQVTDKYIGKKGTKERDDFEYELTLDLLGEVKQQLKSEKDIKKVNSKPQ